MTSDAKIGLLLGLVFIFIIAFVINGFPRFRPNAMAMDDSMPEETFVQDDPIVNKVRNSFTYEEGIVEENNSFVSNNESEGNGFEINNDPWTTDHASFEDIHTGNYYEMSSEFAEDYASLTEEAINAIEEQQEEITEVAENTYTSDENIRYFSDLPSLTGATQEVPIDSSNNKNNSNTEGSVMTPPGRNGFRPGGANGGFRPGGFGGWNQGGQANGFNRPGNGNQSRPGAVNADSQKESDSSLANNRITPPVRPQQANQKFKQTTYVVKKGDNNLAKIAKKLYGEEEGNRLVNINKIYEANKKNMDSPDKIFIGQELIIPVPAPPVKQQPSISKESDNVRNAGRWYVVKEDDSLWKIAAQQLNSGARYEEISKMNTDILTDKNKLKPGMKLRLPAD